MSVNTSDLPIYYFNDTRVSYSANQIRSLITSGVTAPDVLVRTTDAVAFKASDIAEHGLPPLAKLVAESAQEDLYESK